VQEWGNEDKFQRVSKVSESATHPAIDVDLVAFVLGNVEGTAIRIEAAVSLRRTLTFRRRTGKRAKSWQKHFA
jgi:hypothetical protein